MRNNSQSALLRGALVVFDRIIDQNKNKNYDDRFTSETLNIEPKIRIGERFENSLTKLVDLKIVRAAFDKDLVNIFSLLTLLAHTLDFIPT